MSRKLVLAAVATLLSAPMAMADAHAATGDAAEGERAFRTCIACHIVANEAGDLLAGRNGRQGPNLYGIAGRLMGSFEDFEYASGLIALNAAGEIWTEETFAAYIVNPLIFVRDTTGDDSVRAAMPAQRLRGDNAAVDLYAYLASLVAEE